MPTLGPLSRRLRRRSGTGRPEGELGFTLIEAVVSLGVAVGILVGVLTLFDRNNQLARAQTNVAQMQQSVRAGQSEMMRSIRMAGRGGLPRGPIPGGLALGVRNDVPVDGEERHIALGDSDSPIIVPGTDVLTVRGAFSGSVYQVNPLGGGFVLDDPDAPTEGTVRVENPHSTTGVPQDLAPLVDAIKNDPHAALLLVSPVDTWVVVEIDKNTSVTDDASNVVVGFKVGTLAGTEIRDHYLELSGGYPSTLRNVAHLALLEEYRYYVREEHADPLDDASELVPVLMKARFYPNTEVPHPSDPEFGDEIADNILDVQIAMGIDTDGDGRISEGSSGGGEGGGGEIVAKSADEWLFNDGGDVDGAGTPLEAEKWNPALGTPELAYLRLTTIARTDRPDFGYMAPILVQSEDKDFSESPNDLFNSVAERRFRRRQLQTVIDMRNL